MVGLVVEEMLEQRAEAPARPYARHVAVGDVGREMGGCTPRASSRSHDGRADQDLRWRSEASPPQPGPRLVREARGASPAAERTAGRANETVLGCWARGGKCSASEPTLPDLALTSQ